MNMRASTLSLTNSDLEIVDVSKTFGGLKALDGVSFTAKIGKCTGLVGGNGAGKTTMLNCISGITIPSSGVIKVGSSILNGVPIYQIALSGFGRSFQLAEQFHGMRIWEYVTLGAIRKGTASVLRFGFWLPGAARIERELRKVAIERLTNIGFTNCDALLGDLPYGQQKLVDFVRVLMGDPSIILLDEPTSGTGASERSRIGELINHARDDKERIVIIVDHDVEFISNMCDTVVVLDAGKIIANGEAREVLTDQRVRALYAGRAFLREDDMSEK